MFSTATTKAFATRWSPGGVVENLGGAESHAVAVNRTGHIAGSQSGRAVTWNAAGQMVDLGVTEPWSSAYAVNGDGVVAGTLDGVGNSGAYGVNGAGQVVGYSQRRGGAQSAFLVQNGLMRDLNELIAVDSGWQLLEASAINGRGQIVGYGMVGGMQRAFRLDPIVPTGKLIMDIPPSSEVPEPGTVTLLALGLAGVAFGLARRAPERRE
ncbi:MAG: PEP-CTERM sorting domain-containing protein [Acidobacteria bacterium]|nr:PEP-CTERM sorting domain-containing protein [Acidobacteriota bacterium]